MDLGIFGRVDDLVMRGVFAAVSNVVIDGIIEKHGILGNDTNGLMKAVLGDITHILPVDANRTVGDVVKTKQGDRLSIFRIPTARRSRRSDRPGCRH